MQINQQEGNQGDASIDRSRNFYLSGNKAAKAVGGIMVAMIVFMRTAVSVVVVVMVVLLVNETGCFQQGMR